MRPPTMPSRRLDDRIREICAQLTAVGRDPTSTDEQVQLLLQHLMTAIHQKMERLRIIANNKLLQGVDADKSERRLDR
jgi:hypothetical protein